MAKKQKKTVLLAGLSPADMGRCQGMIVDAAVHTAHDQQGALAFIQRGPEVAVIHVDSFDKDFLQKITDSGFKGKLIPVTNSCNKMRSSNAFIAPRDVPDAVSQALAR